MMENEEKEDLLIEFTESEEESCDKEEIDCDVEEKILDFVRQEKPPFQSKKKTLIFTTCLLMFIASSTLVIVLPIYVKYSSLENISTYSKLFTISLANAILFGIVHVFGVILKCECQWSPNHNLSFSEILKVSFFLSAGSISIFWLIDGNYVKCHLEDPLKGCAIVFSLLFYYVFSRKKMSLERTFCAITVIVGVFISVDFGICDKFRCNGASRPASVTPKLHFLYVLLYLFSHGIWVLHFTFIEICWTSFEGSSAGLNSSVFSKVLNKENSQVNNLKQSIQSLSIIYQEEGNLDLGLKSENSVKIKNNKKSYFNLKCPSKNRLLTGGHLDHSIINSAPCFSQLSLCDVTKFPVTSTPKHETNGWQSWSSGRCFDVALWQHITCWLIIMGMSWLQTMPFLNDGKEKLLVDVIKDVIDSFHCHTGWSTNCNHSSLLVITIILTVSYVTLILSSLELMKTVQSTVTLISILMPALPVSSLFWSLFRLNEQLPNLLEFSPEITGEGICAILGLPIMGIGILLLIKSHLKEFQLVM